MIATVNVQTSDLLVRRQVIISGFLDFGKLVPLGGKDLPAERDRINGSHILVK